MPSISLTTPVGAIRIDEEDGQIIRLSWHDHAEGTPTALLEDARRQLEAYFRGDLKLFDLPLAPKGNPFQQTVFAAMSEIPYGETRTYGSIADELGTFGQPVGQACGANPIPIIIPCHRVLSATGLGGYSGAGGLDTKITLLKLENGYPFLV